MRARPAAEAPASRSLRIETVCSSEHRLRFMRCPPSGQDGGKTLLAHGPVYGGKVIRKARPPNARSKPPEMPFHSLGNWTCFRGRVSVIHADVGVLPARPLAAADPGAGGAVAGHLEAAKPLDVEVDHVAGMVMLVAPGGLLRLQALDPGKAGALEHPADGGRRDAGRRGDVGTGQAMAPQGDVRSTTCPGAGLRMRRGLDERSAQPVGPRSRKRPTHLDTVLAVTTNDAATSARLVSLASTRRAISSRARASIGRSCASSSGSPYRRLRAMFAA